MIEIRIRLDYEAKSVRLCEWPAADLDALIPTLGAWGVTSDDAGEYERGDLSGQIRYDGQAAYFEVVIDTDEDAA